MALQIDKKAHVALYLRAMANKFMNKLNEAKDDLIAAKELAPQNELVLDMLFRF